MSCPTKTSNRPDAKAAERRLFAWTLLAALVLLAVLAGPFLVGRVYVTDDLGALHLPTRAFYARQLAHGEPFDWMPQIYAGCYLTGEGQAGTYHPVHWLLYRSLPFWVAFDAECLLPYPFMLLGTWLFLHRRLRRRDAAMLGSLLFAFCGFNTLHFMHLNMVAVLAHLPWLLWAIDVVLTDVDWRRVAWAQAAIAVLTASQLLLGHPQSVWYSMGAEAAFALWILAGVDRAACVRRGDSGYARFVAGRSARLSVAVGCGILLGAVQLLPTADALSHSSRHAADAAFADLGSLHPLNLVQLVAPYLFSGRVAGQNTHELGLYAGAVPLLLSVWMVAGRRRLGSLRPLAWATVGFGLLALLTALGKYGPLYWIQHYLPFVSGFRFPARYLILFQLALAVTAAIGFTMLVRDHRRSRREHGSASVRPSKAWPWLGPLGGVVRISVVAAAAGLFLIDRAWAAPPLLVLAGPVLFVAAASLLVLAARGSRVAMVAIAFVAAADLGLYGFSYSVYPYNARLDQYVASIATPPPDQPGRVAAYPIRFDEEALRMGNQITLAGWSRADGYFALDPKRQLDFSRLPALRLAGVRWVWRSRSADRIEGLVARGPIWLEVPDPLPRLRLVTQTRTSDAPSRDIDTIPLESTALTETPLRLPGGPPGTLASIDDRPGRLRVRCDCQTPQLLVFAETFHPGWQATVDGQPQHVLRVNGDFMGLQLRPGSQQVVLEFRPRSLAIGRLLSLLGAGLVLLGLAIEYLIRARKGRCRNR